MKFKQSGSAAIRPPFKNSRMAYNFLKRTTNFRGKFNVTFLLPYNFHIMLRCLSMSQKTIKSAFRRGASNNGLLAWNLNRIECKLSCTLVVFKRLNFFLRIERSLEWAFFHADLHKQIVLPFFSFICTVKCCAMRFVPNTIVWTFGFRLDQ